MARSTPVALDGGLDTVTAKPLVDSGTILDCLNFEVGLFRGYTRIDGFIRWDGRINPANRTDLLVLTSTAIDWTGTFTVGETLNWTYIDGTYFTSDVVFYQSSGTKTLYLDNFRAGVGLYAAPVPFTVNSSGAAVSSVYYQPLFDSQPIIGIGGATGSVGPTSATLLQSLSTTVAGTAVSQSAANTSISTLMTAYRSAVTQVPGGSLTKIPGLFFMGDTTYAITDLRCISFNLGVETYGIPKEGDTLQAGATNLGTIVSVIKESGEWENSDAAGRIIFYHSAAGSLTTAVTKLKANGLSGSKEFATFVAESADTRATIYKATYNGAGGWTHAVTVNVADVAYGVRRMGYIMTTACEPAVFFPAYDRRGFRDQLTDTSNTGQVIATTATTVTGSWFNPTNVNADDTAGANSALGAAPSNITGDLLVTFTLASVLPETDLVTGIEIEIKKYTTAGAVVVDDCVELLGLSGFVMNKADRATAWTIAVAPNAGVASTYGGDGDLWGNPCATSEVRAATFGVRIRAKGDGGLTNPYIQCVKVKVYYKPQSKKVYIRNAADAAPTDIEATVLHRTIESGTVAASDAKGEIIIVGVAADQSKSRLIGAGEQIRTAAAGAGSLIAITSSNDTVVTLPCSADLETEGSRYESIQASPYTQDGTEVTFICSGAEACYMFDGGALLPIATGLNKPEEKPRHAAYAAGTLRLGYATGTFQYSDVGDPLGFTGGSAGAASLDAQDRVTGLLALPGDAMGVWTERQILGMYGVDVAEVEQRTISPDSGAIEYTVVNMGQPVFADFRGIATVSAIQEYGNFQRGKLSDKVNNILLDRLQSERATQTTNRRPIVAIPIRNKNQYRLFYADGYFDNMTMTSSGPQFMRSRYYISSSNTDANAVKLLGVCTGVTSEGRDVQFFSMDNQPTLSRYVFQMDQGRSFDGGSIASYLTLNPMHLGGPATSKKWDNLVLFGQVYGYATITMKVGDDYTTPTSAGTESASIGASTDTAVESPVHKIGVADISTEGRDVTIRFDHTSATEGPFTLQAIDVLNSRQDRKR